MQYTQCPKCGTTNRTTARFCGKCGATLALQPTLPAAPPAPVQPAAPVMPQYAPQFAGAQAQLPPAQTLVPQVSAVVGKGCSAILHPIARLFTLGGRAAYADLVAPQVLASGMVASQPNARYVAAPVEVGCFVWAILGLLGALTLFAKDWLSGAVVFIVLYMILFALSWVGLRRPFFSRLTLTTLFNLLTSNSRGTQHQLEFTLNTQKWGQVIVTMLGPIPGLNAQTMPQQQHAVELWGIQTGARTIRAWKLGFLGMDYRPVGVELSTARLIPLIAALFIPLTLWLVVWLVVQVAFR